MEDKNKQIENYLKIIDEYYEQLDYIFSVVSECEAGRNVDDLLEVPVCHVGFKRLN